MRTLASLVIVVAGCARLEPRYSAPAKIRACSVGDVGRVAQQQVLPFGEPCGVRRPEYAQWLSRPLVSMNESALWAGPSRSSVRLLAARTEMFVIRVELDAVPSLVTKSGSKVRTRALTAEEAAEVRRRCLSGASMTLATSNDDPNEVYFDDESPLIESRAGDTYQLAQRRASECPAEAVFCGCKFLLLQLAVKAN